jgi:hypothetical protein
VACRVSSQTPDPTEAAVRQRFVEIDLETAGAAGSNSQQGCEQRQGRRCGRSWKSCQVHVPVLTASHCISLTFSLRISDLYRKIPLEEMVYRRQDL